MVSISVQRRSHWGTNIGEHSQYIKLKSKEGWGGGGCGVLRCFYSLPPTHVVCAVFGAVGFFQYNYIKRSNAKLIMAVCRPGVLQYVP